MPVLDDLAVLVLSLADSGQRDFEEYLRQLNERLESFLGHLGDAHAGYTDVLDLSLIHISASESPPIPADGRRSAGRVRRPARERDRN